MSGELDIRFLDDPVDMRRMVALLGQIWGSSTPVIGVELLRAIDHAGGYVAAAYVGDQLVGGSLGFLGRHEGAPSLHSHITGVLPGVRRTGLGRAMKLHQRAWAARHDLVWVTWTFDPLVRRNAWFNIDVLGAEVHEYLVDFYGPMDDAVNAGDETDRLLVAWASRASPRASEQGGPASRASPRASEQGGPASRASPRASEQGGRHVQGAATTDGAVPTDGIRAVPTPEDIVVLRRTDPVEAATWRRRVRHDLGDAMAAGARVVGFTRAGDYLLEGP